MTTYSDLNQTTPQSATPAAEHRRLSPDAVHLWWLSLKGEATAADAALLSPEEQRRAQRLRQTEAMRRFQRGRAQLRRILASYLGASPQTLRFAYAPNGKPSVQEAPRLAFSLTHSGDVGLLAVAWDRAVGVDVELLDRTERWTAVARRCLPEADWRRLQALPEADREWAARRGWVRHEAFLKASGQAALRRLLRWETPCTPRPAEFTIRDPHGRSWLMMDVLGEDVCAALVVERTSPEPPVVVVASRL